MARTWGGPRLSFLRETYKETVWQKNSARMYDPSYHIAVFLSLSVLLNKLDSVETSIVFQNILKFRDAVRIVTVVNGAGVFGLWFLQYVELLVVAGASICVALVSGVAWFVVKIGTTKKELFAVAMNFTKWLFLSFVISIITLLTTGFYLLPFGAAVILAIPPLMLVYSAIIYDHLDSLALGFDEELRAHALTNLGYLHRKGVPIIGGVQDIEQQIKSALDAHKGSYNDSLDD